MVLLIYLPLFVVLGPALAAPIGIQSPIVDWVPEGVEPLQQAFIDFINPIHSPSVNQTITTCLVLILISSISAGPPVIQYSKGATWVRLRLGFLLYGFISPDYFVMGNWGNRIAERSYMLLYNKMFHKEDPTKGWSQEHGAFVIKGGFVLWEDNKPAKTLTFTDLVRMIKAGEVEPPTISKEAILARTTKTRGRIAVWFLYFLMFWFVCKFKSNTPALVELATFHTYMSWYSFFWRSDTILGVVEPVVIMRKPREKVAEPSVLEDGTGKQEKFSSEILVVAGPERKKVEAHSTELAVETATILDKTEENLPTKRSTVFKLLVLAPILTIIDILIEITNLLRLFVHATIAPMKAQWSIISNPHMNFVRVAQYLAQTVVTLLCWGMALGALRRLSPLSDIEQTIWRASSYFLFLQPFILLLAPSCVRTRIGESVKTAIYVLYSLAYSAARLSIFFIAFYSIRNVM